MDQNLRVLFERALTDEPPAPPGDLAQDAMAGGRRRRRRRHLLAGGVAGVVTVLAAAVAVNVGSTPPATPTEMSLMTLMTRPGPGCREPQQVVTEIRVFLKYDVTDQQRADLNDSLQSDPRVRQVRYESKEAAYARFKEMYRDAPDLVAAVRVDQIPESFQVTLAPSASGPALEDELERRPVVEAVVGVDCGRPAKEGE